MRKYLLPNTGRYYKTSLHCHTTVSDGNLTPEQLKDEYKKQDYSVVAFTDHELIVPHSELRDEDFLPITSYEISTTQDKWGSYAKTYHLNIYFRNPGTTTSKTFSEKHVSKKEHMQCRITDEMRAAQGRPREYTKDYIQWVVDTAREEGAIVSLQTKTGFWYAITTPYGRFRARMIIRVSRASLVLSGITRVV